MRARHALTLAAALLTARLATAQIIEVPTFTVGTPTFGSLIQDADVAVGTDGTMLFIWGEHNNRIETDNNALRHVSPAGSPLGPILRGDTSAHVFDRADCIPARALGGSNTGYDVGFSGRRRCP